MFETGVRAGRVRAAGHGKRRDRTRSPIGGPRGPTGRVPDTAKAPRPGRWGEPGEARDAQRPRAFEGVAGGREAEHRRGDRPGEDGEVRGYGGNNGEEPEPGVCPPVGGKQGSGRRPAAPRVGPQTRDTNGRGEAVSTREGCEWWCKCTAWVNPVSEPR